MCVEVGRNPTNFEIIADYIEDNRADTVQDSGSRPNRLQNTPLHRTRCELGPHATSELKNAC
jgi:hypothetical protein